MTVLLGYLAMFCMFASILAILPLWHLLKEYGFSPFLALIGIIPGLHVLLLYVLICRKRPKKDIRDVFG